MQGKDKDKDKGKVGARARARSSGNEDWRMCFQLYYFTFLLLCMSNSGMSPLSTVKLFCDCLNGDRTTYYFCTLALFSH